MVPYPAAVINFILTEGLVKIRISPHSSWRLVLFFLPSTIPLLLSSEAPKLLAPQNKTDKTLWGKIGQEEDWT
jgi:hypothetical protein